MPNFDEAVVHQGDGTTQRFTHEQFFKVPLPDRIKLLWDSKVQFLKAGRPLSPTEALK
jgi:hypothetical protein